MVLTDSCFAASMNEHVFTTITSASSALGVILAPPVSTRPIMLSLSTRFLRHTRLTKAALSVAFLSADFCRGCATVGGSRGMRSFHSNIGAGGPRDPCGAAAGVPDARFARWGGGAPGCVDLQQQARAPF